MSYDRPFMYRHGVDWPEGPYEHFPEWMRPALIKILWDATPTGFDVGGQRVVSYRWLTDVQVDLRLDVSLLNYTEGNDWLAFLERTFATDPRLALSIAEVLLETESGYIHGRAFEDILSRSSSAWTYNLRTRRFESRVEPTLKDQAVAAADVAPQSAAEYLRAAWSEAYGLDPDGDAAYGYAVKAVEAAAKPLVLPNDASATLGKVLGQLNANLGAYRFVIEEQSDDADAISRIVEMGNTLWRGHLRHADDEAFRQHTVEEGRAAVGLAVVLTQFFSDGSIARR